MNRPPRLDCEVVPFAADSVGGLMPALDRVAGRAPVSAEHAHLAAGMRGKAVRAAIVARDPAELGRRAPAARELVAGLGSRSFVAERGIYAGQGPPGRVGLLFPGHGAPVRFDAGALGVICPEAREEFRAIGSGPNPADTSVAQNAIFRASVAGLHWLNRLGLAATAATGYGLGEITALYWAGALGKQDALDLVAVRGRIMAAAGIPSTGMLSIAAAPGTVVDLAEGTDLVVAADNGTSRVVAGPRADIDLVVTRARAVGVAARRLDVGHAFHSPAVAPAEPMLARYLAEVTVDSFPGQVYSTITGRLATPANDIRRMLAQQVTGPVRFREALELLAAECDLLVETGPGDMLTALARTITDVPVVSLDVGADSAVPLGEATAALFALGAITNFDLKGIGSARC